MRFFSKKQWITGLRYFTAGLFAIWILSNFQSPVPSKNGLDLLEKAQQLQTQGDSLANQVAVQATTFLAQNGDWDNWVNAWKIYYLNHFSQSNPEKIQQGINGLKPALKTIETTPAAQAPAISSKIYGFTGNLYFKMGNYAEALKWYEQSVPLAEKATDTVFLVKQYYNISDVLWKLGDDYAALNYSRQALPLAQSLKDTSRMTGILLTQGNIYRTLNQPTESMASYQEALKLSPDNSETWMLMSKLQEEVVHNNQSALNTAQNALKTAASPIEKTDALHQMGRVYLAMKQPEAALRQFNSALLFAAEGYGARHPECAKIQVFRAKAFAQQHHFQQALDAANQCIQSLQPLFNPENIYSNPQIDEITENSLWTPEALLARQNAFSGLFKATNNKNYLADALDCAELALLCLEKIQFGYKADDSRLALSDAYFPACDSAISMAANLYQLTSDPAFAERALRLCEKTKAVVLSDVLYQKEIKGLAGVPDSLRNRERESMAQIAFFEKQISQWPDPQNIPDSLKQALFLARRQSEDLEKKTEKDYPAYAQAKYGFRKTVTLEELRHDLPADAALVEYFTGQNEIFTFVVTSSDFTFHRIKRPANFDATVQKLRYTISDWNFIKDSSQQAEKGFIEESRRLYQLLLERPLAHITQPRLFIVPDGLLHQIPFELLLTDSFSGKWIDLNIPYLIKKRAISYRFAGRSLHQQADLSGEGLGCFGLEYKDPALLSVLDESTRKGTRGGGPLPWTSKELDQIDGIFHGETWFETKATRENFIKNAHRFGILHLAMHGWNDDKNPLRSRLLFAHSQVNEDPFVYASDLYNLQLKAGLVVLSACESGTGQWQRGEGVMSLARAFSFAGCKSLVSSLWNVSDQSTSEIMASFYKKLQGGMPKDLALQAAKLDYLDKVSSTYSTPVYWSAFIATGDMAPLSDIPSGSGPNYWYWALILLLPVLLKIVYKKWRNRVTNAPE